MIKFNQIKSHKKRIFPDTDLGACRTFDLLLDGEVVETFNVNELSGMCRDAGIDIRGLSPKGKLLAWLEKGKGQAANFVKV